MAAAAKLSCALALVGSAAMGDLGSGVAPVCESMLGDVASRGHSDVQLAAYCRASMPPQLCQDAAAALGKQPWSTDRIASACKTWEGQLGGQSARGAPGREAVDFQQLQQYLDQCMHAKAEAGVCQNHDTGKPLSMNECIDYKQRTYPEQTKNIMDALNRFYDVAMGGAPKTATSGAVGRSEQVEPIAVARGPSVGLVVGLGSLVAAALAGAAGFLRLRRRPMMRRALVDTAGEEELVHE